MQGAQSTDRGSVHPETERRRAWMSVLAQAPAERLQALWRDFGASPEHEVLRAPQVGAVMVRGRAGGEGAAFNLGEMTVTRASVRLTSGQVGHAWRPGRDRAAALTAALADAMMQTDRSPALEAQVIAPLRAEAAELAVATAEKAAATKVEFFTMARGD